MELSEFKGIYELDSVDFSNEQVKIWGGEFEDCEVCRFRLNGIVYSAVEDPEDGYRSCMRELSVDENTDMKNTFQPIKVLARYRDKSGTDWSSQEDDILELIDIVTGEIVLEVGTENTNDYYPYFVANFSPEAMCINKENEDE